MERKTNIAEAKQILGPNFIGPDELALIADKMGIKVPTEIPTIPYGLEELKKKQKDYFLILGISQMKNGEYLTLRALRDHFGINPDISEPCFYNQDWYLKESFMENYLETTWFLIQKNIIEKSRGKNPNSIKNQYVLPSAVLCAFTFFSNYLINKKDILWKNDFVWCSDIDLNKDRIYVGRYIDITGFSKNGFSIHRHLKIKNNYGCIDLKS